MNGICFCKNPSTKPAWLDISKKFGQRRNFPHALDGKHVRIQRPKNGDSFRYSYKHIHSIIFMAIAGPEYECLYADPGPQGKRGQGGREVGGASPLTISRSKIIFFQVKSENIKFLHVKNI